MPRKRESSESKSSSRSGHQDVRHKSTPTLPPSSSASTTEEMRQQSRHTHKLKNLGRSYSTPARSSEHDLDLLSSQSNGSTTKDSESKPSKTTIRVMWKNAFRSLKMKDKDKDKDGAGDDRSEKSASGSDDKKYSRMSSMKKGLLKQKDQPANAEEEPEITDEASDPVFAALKFAAAIKKAGNTSD